VPLLRSAMRRNEAAGKAAMILSAFTEDASFRGPAYSECRRAFKVHMDDEEVVDEYGLIERRSCPAYSYNNLRQYPDHRVPCTAPSSDQMAGHTECPQCSPASY
jgi:hypothetical protein